MVNPCAVLTEPIKNQPAQSIYLSRWGIHAQMWGGLGATKETPSGDEAPEVGGGVAFCNKARCPRVDLLGVEPRFEGGLTPITRFPPSGSTFQARLHNTCNFVPVRPRKIQARDAGKLRGIHT